MHYICQTSQLQLKRDEMLAQAAIKQQSKATIVDIIDRLGLYISCIPFKCLFALPRGRQLGIYGTVVNVSSVPPTPYEQVSFS
jgi:hypothetical protein